MENLNSMLASIETLTIQLLGNILFYSLLGVALSILTSIFIIKYCKRNGTFNRSNGLWSFVAKCNYIILPISLLLVGITQGGIYGAHTTAEEWIEGTTDPITEYAETYLPTLQHFVNSTIPNPSTVSLEDAITTHQQSQTGSTYNSVYTQFQISMVGGFLDIVSPTGGDIAEPLVLLSQIDIHRLDRNVFELLPSSMRTVCSIWFAPFYWALLSPFCMYLLVAIGEILFFRMVAGEKGHKQESSRNGSYILTSH